jgi:hypothetical protein
LTFNQVADATVTGISDGRSNRLLGDIFMCLNESNQTRTFVDRPGGRLYTACCPNSRVC